MRYQMTICDVLHDLTTEIEDLFYDLDRYVTDEDLALIHARTVAVLTQVQMVEVDSD